MRGRRAHDREVRRLSLLSPPGMVAAVGERRAAGDWRGACAAALVDVHVDLAEVGRRWGRAEAERIRAELRGFAPDLLRRFLPRSDSLALLPRRQVALSRSAVPFPDRPGGTAVLALSLPTGPQAPQRLGLRVVDATEVGARWHDLPDWCWHVDAVANRRWAYGASENRLPWHHPDGRPYGPDEVTPGQPMDRAAEAERLIGLCDGDDLLAAFRAAGFAVDTTPPRYGTFSADAVVERLSWLAPTLPLLAAETLRLAHRYDRPWLRTTVPLFGVRVGRDGSLALRAGASGGAREVPWVGLPAPVDVALLRSGALSADDLHPLVHEALFPGRVPGPPAPPPQLPDEFRVRCGGDWHLLRIRGAHLVATRHDEAEIARELLLARLGGPIGGCAGAVRAWRTGAKPVPKEIRRHRAHLLTRVFHGDTDSVLALVGAGLDPDLRDPTGGTLLHSLSHLDHARALPVLLAAGLDVHATDGEGRTPLQRASAAGAPEVVAALVDAGAHG
ncbi:ankyrin repeat domain-containing protein [Micromonospora auratinigra]|uniref:Ankyrin repeat-containing protein n=1 Tax=Micromonospora auratinigra TaxID=261654 RepID=A0A1A8Z8K8_9ACTN|nr:ankyrin repeat domain-containing protein [Micromonospora auratinigra]SBT40196.1 Ankyrin repeat-containing protein [Micromonospora auratinigra]